MPSRYLLTLAEVAALPIDTRINFDTDGFHYYFIRRDHPITGDRDYQWAIGWTPISDDWNTRDAADSNVEYAHRNVRDYLELDNRYYRNQKVTLPPTIIDALESYRAD